MPNFLKRMKISGFKSIKDTELTLSQLNVLIGANGAGKSNLLSFFSLLNYMLTSGLQIWVGKQGGAGAILHYGAKKTPLFKAELELITDVGTNWYEMSLVHAARDTLIFNDEQVRFQRSNSERPPTRSLGAGHKESLLRAEYEESPDKPDKTVEVIRYCLSRYRMFQFHDTSHTANMRNLCDLDNDRYLYSDGGNIAAILYKIKQKNPEYYQRIIKVIQQLAPFFDDFVLEKSALNSNQILLRWKSRHSEYEFGPQHLSDGTLRSIALITLLLQPPENLPLLVLLDEPELGLHPYAVTLLGGIIRTASHHTQIILATQSPFFLDQFDLNDMVVVEQQQGCSVFKRLDEKEFSEWLDEYSPSQLWVKNVIGGRPTR